jgi:asparagine synthase (glutamine-hydrolysing)
MGGLSFIIYNSNYKLINRDFMNSFINSQHRGLLKTEYNMVTSYPAGKIKDKNIRLRLSRSEIESYLEYTFLYGYHNNPIIDPSFDAVQPFIDPILHKMLDYPELRKRQPRLLMCNGSIYNYQNLMEESNINYNRDLQSKSDVEIIMPLYISNGIDQTIKKLNGDYSFVIADNITSFDLKSINVFAVRDIIGARPLYYIKEKNGNFFMFSSELKSVPDVILNNNDYIISQVPPGKYWSFQNAVMHKNPEEFITYFDWDHYNSLDSCVVLNSTPSILETTYSKIKTILKKSIIERCKLNSEMGILLSGGFDSSIILSVLANELKLKNHDFTKYPLHVFSIGDSSNKDVISAQQCVDYIEQKHNIDIIHHIINIYDNVLFIQNIKLIINILETYDKNVIRSGLIMHFLFDYIKTNTNVKVLLTGEGLDELCGYKDLFEKDYSHYQKRSVEYIKNMHRTDLLKCDKLASYNGIELRHPFLSKEFIIMMLELHPSLKMPEYYNIEFPKIEKYIVRKAFDLPTDIEYLPHDILWRPMQDINNSIMELEFVIKKYCDEQYTDAYFYDYVNKNSKFNINSKEELYYINIFLQLTRNYIK